MMNLEFCKVVPSPFGRGARGEGLVKVRKQVKAFFRAAALTLTLSRRERGLRFRSLQKSR